MPKNLAIAAFNGRAIDDSDVFTEVDLPIPTPAADEVVVQLEAISLNPIDTKLRANLKPQAHPKIFGYDGVGHITAIGSAVQEYTVGQRVFYAGTTQKAGSYQHFQAVPAHLTAPVPERPAATDLAAIPLVGLTAWELLFEKMGFTPALNANAGKALLVINGAGGVGSMLTQLAHWAGLQVIATASPKNFDWLRAHHVDQPLDYHDDWAKQIPRLVDGIAILYAPEPYLAQAVKLIAPLGHIGTIVTPTKPLELADLKPKAASFDQEYMFTKSDFNVAYDSTKQILNQLATLYDAGVIQASVTNTAPFDLKHLVQATKAIEAGHSVGKTSLFMKA